jgi:hypothetical protein
VIEGVLFNKSGLTSTFRIKEADDKFSTRLDS